MLMLFQFVFIVVSKWFDAVVVVICFLVLATWILSFSSVVDAWWFLIEQSLMFVC